MAFVYFEKLALKGKLNKQNRKLCAGACVLLAAKIGSDLRKHEVKHLIDVRIHSLPPAPSASLSAASACFSLLTLPAEGHFGLHLCAVLSGKLV